MQASRVCLHCWHNLRVPCEENEAHVLFRCPAYHHQRCDFTRDVTATCTSELSSNFSDKSKMEFLFACQRPQDWEALGRFLARVRQIRRKMRSAMINRNAKLLELTFETQRKEWRRSGRHVCRHGVFFDETLPHPCPCTQTANVADWSRAILMPALHDELKCIVTDTFARETFQRLGVLQAEVRRRGW